MVEAMDPKPWPITACRCCGCPALVGDREPWWGIECSRCGEGAGRGDND